MLLAAGIACCIPGCGKPDPDALAAATVANRELSDARAIEELARQAFSSREAVSVEGLPDGGISLSVTIHPRRDANVKTLKGGPGAAEVDSAYVLARSVFDGRRMVKFGRQRGLSQLAIKIKHTVLDETGKETDVDIFGYTLAKDSFDRYLTTGSASDLVAGKALTTIEKACVIDYNNFGQIRYTKP